MIPMSCLYPLLFFGSGLLLSLFSKRNFTPLLIRRIATFFLVAAIGWKGGVSIAKYGQDSGLIWALGGSGLLLGFSLPFLSYLILRTLTRVDRINAAAISAHYGSVSLITFITAVGFLENLAIPYQGFILAVLAMMEFPAIFSGMLIAKWWGREKSRISRWELVKDIGLNPVILLLILSMAAGCGAEKFLLSDWMLAPLKIFPFVLNFFLFDMGMTVGTQRMKLKNFDLSLGAFGLYMPLIGALIGGGISQLLSLDLGTGMLFTVLAASASYIAVPAVMRICLPKADEALYFPLSMGITFPFNITVGIPLYHRLAMFLLQ